LVCAIVLLPGVSRADEPTLTIGYAKCAQCAPISLLPEYAKNVKIKVLQFNTGNDVLTALVSKSIDVAQISYLHYINALDKGFDVVAISGHISGGSQCLSSNSLGLAATDWSELKRIVAAHKRKEPL
jgi:ABC-type nitrate/sulfonate/bicarbonate transport system substrate-binding protein